MWKQNSLQLHWGGSLCMYSIVFNFFQVYVKITAVFFIRTAQEQFADSFVYKLCIEFYCIVRRSNCLVLSDCPKTLAHLGTYPIQNFLKPTILPFHSRYIRHFFHVNLGLPNNGQLELWYSVQFPGVGLQVQTERSLMVLTCKKLPKWNQ